MGEHRQSRVLDRGRISEPTLGIGERPPQQLLHLSRLERAQLVDLATREQRRIHLEVRVLRGGPDQRQQPFLDSRQQRVLLSLVEAVNLVEKQNRGTTATRSPLPRSLDHGPDLSFPRIDRRLLLEGAFGPGSSDPSQRRLASPGRSVQDRAMRMTRLDRRPQRRPGRQHMLLPDKLIQAPRPHPHRQRSIGSGNPSGGAFTSIEQPVSHHGQYEGIGGGLDGASRSGPRQGDPGPRSGTTLHRRKAVHGHRRDLPRSLKTHLH